MVHYPVRPPRAFVRSRPHRRALRRDGGVGRRRETADAAQRLLPSMVATTWPGGSNAYRHVDFASLRGRKVICVPDADEPGRNAFHGRQDRRGKRIPGVLELLAGVGALTRVVDPEATRPDGWDLADAEAEGWGAAEAIGWLKSRLVEVRDAA